MVSERYVGTAAEVEALLDAREERMLPERTRHLDFGAVAAAWGLLADLGVAASIDAQTGPGPSGLPLPPGTYLAPDALPRIEEKLALAACARFGLDTSSVALDMTNFATFIDTGNERAPIAQRGKA